MLESILRAAGRRTVAAGNIGRSLVEVVMDPQPWDVIAVEVGAPQLPFVHTMSPQAAVCLNLAPDHIDLFGSFEAYRAAKGRIYERTQVAAVYNEADEATMHMVEQAEVIIENQVTDFMHWLGNRELVPTIRALRDTAERARRDPSSPVP